MSRVTQLILVGIVGLAWCGRLPADEPAAITALRQWSAADAATREDLSAAKFAQEALSRADAKLAAEILWQDHALRVKETRAQEMKERKIKLSGKEMPFWYKVYGEKPAGGRSLFISLHGGGGAPKRVNDSQWENQKRLYQPKEGVYVAPRAASDTWNLWHEAHIDPLFARLIENLVVFEDVDPNRVYVMGYSAGGDGVYQLAPRMADRWAAAAMMAGHPNEASPLGLRNLPFTLHVGGLDSAYNRNKVAKEWGEKLAKLRADDPAGYLHELHVHENKGHWMDREDAVAVEWMAKHARNPLPERIVWRQDDVKHARFYWLAVDPATVKAGATVTATRAKQQISLETKDAAEVTVLLSDELADLDQPVTISANGKPVHNGPVKRTIATLARTLADYGDPKLIFSAAATVRCQ